jgi:hypothetical protein
MHESLGPIPSTTKYEREGGREVGRERERERKRERETAYPCFS